MTVHPSDQSQNLPRRPRPALRHLKLDAVTPACALVLAVLLALMARDIRQSTAEALRGVEERQSGRVLLAREFLDAYVNDVLDRTRATAEVVLSGPAPTEADLSDARRQMSFHTALLLDPDGRAITAVPSDPGLTGRNLGDELANLRIARGGRANVSPVVTSVSTGQPIVAFAVPFATPYGTRVLSGGFTITDTPLGAFLRSFSSIAGNAIYLVDPEGRIVAANDPGVTGKLVDRDPLLADAMGTGRSGHHGPEGGRYFTSEDVHAAPWRLVISVPTEGLYASVNRSQSPWILFGAFAAAGSACVGLVSRVTWQRRQLASLAEHDALTGLHNRRHIDRWLRHEFHRRVRGRRALTVLLIDVDHFKQINDRYGHQRGDDTLIGIARALEAAVSPDDVVARWGGEEFIVLAPGISDPDAALLAERLRHDVARTVKLDGTPVTVSIGYTTMTDQPFEAITSRADVALYRAKSDGRNRCVTLDTDGPAPAHRLVTTIS